MNSLKVHVRSGINTLNTGWTGFVCFHSGCYACDRPAGDGGPKDPAQPALKPSTGSIDNKANSAQQAITLNDRNILVLNQNVPNPFAESTVITYSIPESFTRAQLVFRNAEGNLVKAYDIRQAGKGSITVFADDLSKGTYSYSLMIDGREADTKKMVKQ
jgi:hypothetical protein